MAASVRVEDEAFSDLRYHRLARLAGLADADHARGKLLVLWRQCTVEQTHVLHVDDVRHVLGDDGVEALCEARLGERVGDDQVRIRGTQGRIEWLQKLRENGKKGGRPRKNQGENQKVSARKTKRKPSGSADRNPPAPAPAPAPAYKNPPIPPTGGNANGTRRTRQLAEAREVAERVLGKLNERTGRRYSPATDAHLKLVAARLAEGWTELQLRQVVWHKANEWGESEMDKYLRPSTLFQKSKFADYVAEAEQAYAEARGETTEPPPGSGLERLMGAR